MNRIYKVIWNDALNCFTAVGEYAKGRGKSSKSSVNANSTTSNLSSINTLRMSAIGLGLLAAGFAMQTNATGIYFTGDNPTPKVYINPYETLNVKGGETVTGDYHTKNISVTANSRDDSLTIKLDKTVDLGVDGSLKTGDTLVDRSGIKITANNAINNVKLTSLGLNNGHNKIINVDDGDITATSKDAVNGSQLNSLTNTVAANKTKYYSVNSDVAGNANNDGATGRNAMAMGGNTTATGEQAIAIGSGTTGQHTTASGEQSIAIGANVVSKGHSSIALGGDDLNYASKANIGNNSTSTMLNGGSVNTVFKDYAGKDMVEGNQFDVNTESGGAASIAIGVKSQSKGDLSTAVGVHANSAGTASLAFGMAASATKKGAVALGAGALSDAQDGVALGSKSVANVAGGATGFVPMGALLVDKNAIIATKSVTLGAVSVGTGAQGGNRQIVNVAAGTNGSDAVNVAQLTGLQNGINATLNQGIDFGGDSGNKVNRKIGEKLSIKGGETDGTKLASGNNIGVVADGADTLTMKLAKNLTGLTSVSTGDTVMNMGGISFLGGSTVSLSSTGLNNGGKQITNVASGGTTATNAANIGDISSAVAANKTQYYSVNSTGGSNDDNLGATGQNAIAMGRNASATGGQAIAIGSGGSGQHTTASGQQSIAIGANVVSKGASSIAIGGDDLDAASKANIDGTSASAINGGDVNTTFKAYTGRDLVETPPYMVNTESGGAASIAMGAKALSKGALSTAIGIQSSSAGVASSAFGMGSSASLKGSVALGAGSTTATNATSESTMTVGGTTYTIAGPATRAGDQVSIGSAGAERQIKHVAGGAISASSTDAVNGSQLHATNTAVNNNTTTIGSGLNFDGDTGDTVNRQLGQTLTVKGGATNLSDNNIGVVADGTNTLTVKLAKDLTGLDSVSTGNSLINTNGLSIANGPKFTATGINANNQQIQGVASGGTVESNAANIGDLNTAITEVSTLGFGLKAADGHTVQKPLGQAIEVVGSNNNIGTRVKNGKIEVQLNDNLDLGNNGSVSTGNIVNGTSVNRLGIVTGGLLTGGVTTVSGAGVSVTGLNPFHPTSAALTSDGLTILNGPSVTKSGGINAGNKKVVNVADGVSAKDAVNVSQLTSASAAARTKVLKGTNVASVDFSTNSVTGQDIYTVNANGVTASAGSSAVTVTAGDKDAATNMTDYAVDLSEDSKASLVKADSAMQSVVTQIDGTKVKTLDKADNTANFLTGDNIVLTAQDGGIKVSTAEDVSFTSVTTGDTLLNTEGLSFLGASSVRLSQSGLNNGGNKITEVADGKDDTDAVNIRQLNATNSTLDLGLDFTGDDTTVVVNRKLGQTLTIQGGATNLTKNNIGIIADEKGNLNVRLAEDVMLGKNGSVRMENTVLNNAGVTITDGPNQTITLSNEGLDNGNNRIIKVGEGIAPSDAVNFAQLTKTNNEIAKGINIGDGNSANDQQFALGDTINVTGDSNLTTVASATGVQVKLNNQLNLGEAGSLQIGNSIINSSGFTFVDNGSGRTVMLGSLGLDNGGNTIRNVGKGTLNTDAVNVEQLKEVAIALDQGWGITAQGDIATMVKQGDAVDLSSRDGNIKVSRKSVNTAATRGGNPSLQAAAIPTNANDINFDLNPDITLDSVTTGDTTMNDNGLTIAGGPSITKIGIDAADNKITNVRNGEVTVESQDAINGSQLYAQGSGISSIIGGATVYNPVDGTFTNSNIGGTGQGNIDGAIASIRQGTVAINENVQTNTTNITTNTTNIATNTSNIATNVTNIKANKDRLDVGLKFGADSGANINKSVGDSSVLSFTGGNNITTTAAGSSIKFDLNGNINVDSVTTGKTTLNNNGVTIADGPSMTVSGINAASNKITNVADGVAPRDAVNFGQLDAVNKRLGDNMNQLGYKINEVEDDANAGISAAMAMSSLPQAYIVGKSMIGGGVGTYNGESAVAIGFSKLSNDGRWVMKLNGTADTQGNAGASIGAGFHFD